MSLKDKIIEKLKTVYDPELRQDVITLKLVSNLKVDEEKGEVSLTFRPTAYLCPIGIQLALMIKQAILKVEGVKKVKMEVVDFVYAKQAMEYLEQLDQTEDKKD
jgi:metal-sulfur cluster biosynthetic enzyme